MYFNDDESPSRVIDPAGNTIWYGYGGDTSPYFDDNLTSVAYAEGAQTPTSNTPTRTYHYEVDEALYRGRSAQRYAGKMLTGITDERGVRFATWDYALSFQDGRHSTNYFHAISSENAGNDTYTLDNASNAGSTSVTNPLGKTTIYTYETINGV